MCSGLIQQVTKYNTVVCLLPVLLSGMGERIGEKKNFWVVIKLFTKTAKWKRIIVMTIYIYIHIHILMYVTCDAQTIAHHPPAGVQLATQ